MVEKKFPSGSSSGSSGAPNPSYNFSTQNDLTRHAGDTDLTHESNHHTIGTGPTQAAAGNHKHEYTDVSGLVIDHGKLQGLEDDDHVKYPLASNGVRATGTWPIDISGNAATATYAADSDKVDGKHATDFADKSHMHIAAAAIRKFYIAILSTAPPTGYIHIESIGGQDRRHRVSKIDYYGQGYNLEPMLPGDTIAITDDPETPPVTGWARYVVTTDVIDQGTYWQYDTIRTDTSGSTAVTDGSVIRYIPTLAAGMPSAPMALDDLTDVNTAGKVDNDVLGYDQTSNGWIPKKNPAPITDHGLLSGLSDDDHPQYLKKSTEWLMTNNGFVAKNLFQSELHNGFFLAHRRFTVTGYIYKNSDSSLVREISDNEFENLFNGNYESWLDIPAGHNAVIELSFVGMPGGVYPGYPYGNILASFYQRPVSVTGQVYYLYEAQGGPAWAPMPVSDAFAPYQVVQLRNDYYQAQKFQLVFVSPEDSHAYLTQIDFDMDRPITSANEFPHFNKMMPQNIYKQVTFVNGASLILDHDPTQDLEPATKHYVDIQSPDGGVTQQYVDDQDALRVLKSGDSMTGALILAGDPTSDLEAATKLYVDTNAGSGGVTQEYVDDQDALRVAKTGDTMSGKLILNGGGGSTLDLKAGLSDHVYMGFFADTHNPTVRSGFMGFGSAGGTQLTINNAMTNGNTVIECNGTGKVIADGVPNVFTGATTPSGQKTGDIWCY